MFFSGYCFTGGHYSLDTTSPLTHQITSVEIKNGAFDELQTTRNAEQLYTPGSISDQWYFGTVLHAYFKGNTFAGNVNFTVENTDYLLIKRRMKDSFNWVSVFAKQVYGIDDFMFELFDYTARSNTEYEYALLPVSGGIEGDFIINSISTCFPGLFIMERGKYYSTIIEVKFNDQQQNKPVSTIVPLGRRYPFINSNSVSNYKSGNLSAIFADMIEKTCEYDFKSSWKLREELNAFLYNGIPKLIKYEDGRMYLASVSSEQINESSFENDHYLVQTSFNWSEMGNCDNGNDLFKYGFTDVRSGVMSEISMTEDRLNRLEYDLRKLRAEKADNLIMDDNNGTIRLSADGKPLGESVNLETRYGKEFAIRRI